MRTARFDKRSSRPSRGSRDGELEPRVGLVRPCVCECKTSRERRKAIVKAIGGSGALVAAVAVSLIAVACGGGGSSAAPTVQASMTPPATASATPLPLVEEGGAPLGPGTYTTVF